ncbi:hypothetical protein [Bifidobacterium aerophilum]|uniref:Uncharacterized protein n=1 Tax=Bifidobacterium aerophilum TaxID=1798155 RepID=A0A6N9Z980_9BIFI|nr:hypothetical protein [Bifidobacterium aerophilum]NEG90653.1 hypothetical protein [Bifidobacterium aerophilum]
MIPPTEQVPFTRHQVTVEHGRRIAGEPVELGSLGVLVAPGTFERVAEAGRVTVATGCDLYLRGKPPFEVMAGDTAMVRGEPLTVTRTPEEWRRGDTVIGVQYHAERRKDTT